MQETEQPDMFKAEFQDNANLVIIPVVYGVYRRIGTQGLSETPLQAVEALKLATMDKFLQTMKAIDWQAMSIVKREGDIYKRIGD